jgi:hypothetical protein
MILAVRNDAGSNLGLKVKVPHEKTSGAVIYAWWESYRMHVRVFTYVWRALAKATSVQLIQLLIS